MNEEIEDWNKLDLVDKQNAIDLLGQLDEITVLKTKEDEEPCEDSPSKEK